MNTNSITQEYLEDLCSTYRDTNKLVDEILERTVSFAKDNHWAASMYIHKDEYDIETMRKAYKKLRERKFIVTLKEFEDDVNGLLGEIKIYLDSKALLDGNKLTDENFDAFLDKLNELA